MSHRVRTTAVAILVFVLPLVASAKSIPFFGPIVPECSDGVNALGWGAVLLVINNLILFGLSILIFFIAPLVIAYAGFLLVFNPISPSGKSKAKEMLMNLVIGLVVALSGWVIVGAVMAVFYDPSAKGFGTQWYEIITSGGANVCLPKILPTPRPPISNAPPITTTTTPKPPSGTTAAQKQALENSVRSNLGSTGVLVNKSWCPPDTPYQSVPGGCTDVGGLQPATISYAKKIRLACGTFCSATMITGGSELGHASGAQSHASGYKIDLADTPQLDTFACGGPCRTPPVGKIYDSGQLKYAGQRAGDGGGPSYEDGCGNVWVRESTHWDVLVTRDCENIRAR